MMATTPAARSPDAGPSCDARPPRDALRAHDAGVVTPIETMYVMIFALIAIAFLGYLGRTIGAGVEVTNAAQDGARAASIAADPAQARVAAAAAVTRSGLPEQCQGTAAADLTWQPSVTGDWRGGTVTVTVSCTVTNRSLTTLWSPGVRTITVSDTQVIDRFRR